MYKSGIGGTFSSSISEEEHAVYVLPLKSRMNIILYVFVEKLEIFFFEDICKFIVDFGILSLQERFVILISSQPSC